MSYGQRLATADDLGSLARLWENFVNDRAIADPTLNLKPNFDFNRYVGYQLRKPLSFCFLLQCDRVSVGFLSIYFYDEAPPPEIAQKLEELENPFLPRRVGTVLGLSVEEAHRKSEAIALLVDAAFEKAREFQITDIDLLVSSEQMGLHALLQRLNFTRSAIQYRKQFAVSRDNLPSLQASHYREGSSESDRLGAIPLRDPLTNEAIEDLQGEIVYLYPLTDARGNPLQSSRGLPIYPLPLRDPDSQGLVWDGEGNLVVCPLELDETGKAIEIDGLTQFQSPVYEYENGRLLLKRDEASNYFFQSSRTGISE